MVKKRIIGETYSQGKRMIKNSLGGFAMVPKDPVMLLSYINTQLRDNYPSIQELCSFERAMELAGCEGSIESGTVDPDTGVITDFSYEEGNYRAFYRGGEIGVEGRAAAETPGWSVEKR